LTERLDNGHIAMKIMAGLIARLTRLQPRAPNF